MICDDLTFLHSGMTPECAARVDKHFDGYCSLQFGVSGGVTLSYDAAQYDLAPGQPWFWTAFPGPHIRFHVCDGEPFWWHRYAAFCGPRVARWKSAGLWLETPQALPAETAPAWAARFDELLALLQAARRDDWKKARAVHALEGMLLELGELRAQAAPPNSTAAPAPSWLDELLASQSDPNTPFVLDYARFAKTHHLALPTLRRKFREWTGTPLHEWAVQGRIARARAYLGETDLPIGAIAEKLGYNDVYFFTRQFRERVGVPPGAYRKSRQG